MPGGKVGRDAQSRAHRAEEWEGLCRAIFQYRSAAGCGPRACAKDNSTLSVKRPTNVVLNCCVTETKEAVPRIEDLDDLGKIGQRAGQPVDLVDHHGINPTRDDIGEQPSQRRPIIVAPKNPPSL